MNLYEKLDVPKNADAGTIKKAYRKKAQKSHPDKAGGSEKEFQEVKKAYEVLIDPARRERYDQDGDERQQPPLENQALTHFATLVITILSNANKYTKVLEECKKHINKERNSKKQVIQQVQRAIDQRMEVAARFKVKEGKENMVADFLRANIEGFKGQIAGIEKELEMIDLVETMLNDYEYESEEMYPEKTDAERRQLSAMDQAMMNLGIKKMGGF
jgi:curved DNA-binding protein CbpA